MQNTWRTLARGVMSCLLLVPNPLPAQTAPAAPALPAQPAAASGFRLGDEVRQCILVVAEDWEASGGVLSQYEKTGEQAWKKVSTPFKVRLGKSGLVWGLGLHPVETGSKNLKQEHDGKSPCGVFRLFWNPDSGVYGYAPDVPRDRATPYHRVTSRDLWDENPDLPTYNKHLVLDHEPATVWEKKAQMKQNDPAHALKLFILHNAETTPVKNGGSSIFFHIWRANGEKPTSGCTTMEEGRLKGLIAWLQPVLDPVYVLLPRTEYERLKPVWRLP